MSEELEQLQSREAGEEIQLAETKLAMHKEMLEKDEQVSLLETKLAMHKEMEKDEQVSLLEQACHAQGDVGEG